LPAWLGGGNRPYGRQVLTLRPLRHPSVSWERSDDENLVVITIGRRNDAWTSFAARMFGLPPTRKIELTDEISSYVWTCCDGNHSVAQIVDDISARYKLGRRQSEVSVLTFLKTLQTKRLIGVPVAQAKSFKESPVMVHLQPDYRASRKSRGSNGAKRIGGKRG
jgi:hypothetical protein